MISLHSKNRVLVFDMDEVLVNISPQWYRLIRENWNLFEGKVKDLGDLTEAQVLSRDKYYIEEWLRLGDSLNPEVNELILDLYRKGDFYAGCVPTSIGDSLQILAQQSVVKKIYIVSHTIPETLDSKLKFVKKYFNHDKIEFVSIPLNTTKSEFLNTIEYTTFVDDSPEVMKDVITNTKSDFKEFLMPELGYNNLNDHPELLALINDKMLTFKTYRVLKQVS